MTQTDMITLFRDELKVRKLYALKNGNFVKAIKTSITRNYTQEEKYKSIYTVPSKCWKDFDKAQYIVTEKVYKDLLVYINKHNLDLFYLVKNSFEINSENFEKYITFLPKKKDDKSSKLITGEKKPTSLEEWAEVTKYNLTQTKTKYEKKVLYELKKIVGKSSKSIQVQAQFIVNGKVYFPDIYVKSRKTIIEVDGGYHDDEAQKIKDKNRDSMFQNMGIKVVRIKNEQCNDTAQLRRILTDAMARRKK